MHKHGNPLARLRAGAVLALVLAVIWSVSPTGPVAGASVSATHRPAGLPVALQPRQIIKPIPVRTPVAVLPGSHLAAPGLYDLQVSAAAVTVRWYDRSDNELGFKVFKRDLSGTWQPVYQVPTRARAGSTAGLTASADDYSWADTSTAVSGQCSMIAAYNETETAYTAEQCTVRPDPSQFPQYVGGAAMQW